MSVMALIVNELHPEETTVITCLLYITAEGCSGSVCLCLRERESLCVCFRAWEATSSGESKYVCQDVCCSVNVHTHMTHF